MEMAREGKKINRNYVIGAMIGVAIMLAPFLVMLSKGEKIYAKVQPNRAVLEVQESDDDEILQCHLRKIEE